jgi:hypothetical protein
MVSAVTDASGAAPSSRTDLVPCFAQRPNREFDMQTRYRCQACADCGILDAYGFHEHGCPALGDPMDRIDAEYDSEDGTRAER